MLAFRLFVGLGLTLIVFSLLGYALSRDCRWLSIAASITKGLIALVVLLFLFLALERVLLVV